MVHSFITFSQLDMGLVVWNSFFSIQLGIWLSRTDELIVFRGVGLNHQPDGNIHFSSSEEFIAINIFMDYSWVIQIWAWGFVWFPWWFPHTGASPPGLTGASPSALATTRTSWTALKLGVGRQLKWGGTPKIRHKRGNWENHGKTMRPTGKPWDILINGALSGWWFGTFGLFFPCSWE